jgi:L-asparaginase
MYKIVNLPATGETRASILIIYTGGTFGMMADESGALKPFNFGKVVDKIPELSSMGLAMRVISFPEPIDSSNVQISHWRDMAYIIEENYGQYDGFVILHGTDTMAYSASALSFMLKGLNKPVIFTGAQLPVGHTRSDARENLITALEIASAKTSSGEPIVSEVCIYFNFFLLRGNRSQKVHSSTFSAFRSENYPVLAESGITIDYNRQALRPYDPSAKVQVEAKFDPHVTVLKLFPGIMEEVVKATLAIPDLKAVVLETFGSGNTMNFPWFLQALREAIDRGLLIVNVSQCLGGTVMQGKYETSAELSKIGVLSGGDLTCEAALAKLMMLLGTEESRENVRKKFQQPLCGEMDRQ